MFFLLKKKKMSVMTRDVFYGISSIMVFNNERLFALFHCLQVLMPHSILLSLSFYSGFSVLGVVTVLLLPIETKGRALQVRRTR